MPRQIWTREARRLLYTTLVQRFGPSCEWEKTSSPGHGLDGDFERFCVAFAEVIDASSAEAVKQQIRFAMPETEHGSTWEQGRAQAAILNKAAALEAGFIRDSQVPDLLAVGRTAATA